MQGFSLALFGGSRLRRAPPQSPKRIFACLFLVNSALGAGGLQSPPAEARSLLFADFGRLRPADLSPLALLQTAPKKTQP